MSAADTSAPSPEGLTLDVMAERLRLTEAWPCIRDQSHEEESEQKIAFILTGMSHGHARRLAMRDILARLNAAPVTKKASVGALGTISDAPEQKRAEVEALPGLLRVEALEELRQSSERATQGVWLQTPVGARTLNGFYVLHNAGDGRATSIANMAFAIDAVNFAREWLVGQDLVRLAPTAGEVSRG